MSGLTCSVCYKGSAEDGVEQKLHCKFEWHPYNLKRKSLSLPQLDTVVAGILHILKWDLAFDLSLSALLGENIYNFGELLAHPIIKSLMGTKVEWLYYILEAFNTGDLVRYQELCRVHGATLSSQPALVQNEKKLLEKINILCLMEITFSRPSEDRTIPLSIIAERTKLTVEDVEYLLMKSLSVDNAIN